MMKKVLVTGASGGIGKEIAKKFYDEGFFVVLSGRDEKKLEHAAQKFKKNFDIIICDLASNEDVLSFCNKVEEKHDIEILVNNAGVTQDSLFLRMSEKKWDNVLNTNLKSNFILSNHFIKGMIKKRWGRIINITSVVCHTGNPGQANYCASKSGIIGMSKSIALEVAKRGITVNCISPGFIETAMTENLNEQQKKIILNSIPLGKVGTPADIANSVMFLASESSDYITGQTIHVNGGLSMI